MLTTTYAHDEHAIATITLNRDEKRNAISQRMAEEILQSLDRSEAEQARVVILRANPSVKVWCAGHDLSELDPQDLDGANPTLQICRKLQTTPLPVIAMVEGSVYAGGLMMLLSADLAVAAENTRVTMTANKLGIPLAPDFYAYWLRVMGIHKTKELLFTAAAISATDAYHAGLFNHVVPRDQLERTTREIARKILDCTAEGVANTKLQLNLLATQTSLSEEHQAHIRQRHAEIVDSPQTRQRISALLARLSQ